MAKKIMSTTKGKDRKRKLQDIVESSDRAERRAIKRKREQAESNVFPFNIFHSTIHFSLLIFHFVVVLFFIFFHFFHFSFINFLIYNFKVYIILFHATSKQPMITSCSKVITPHLCSLKTPALHRNPKRLRGQSSRCVFTTSQKCVRTTKKRSTTSPPMSSQSTSMAKRQKS